VEKLKWQELIAKVERAIANDPSLKEKLLATPRASLQEVVGCELPPSFTDENIRSFAGKVFQPGAEASDELSDLELERVAGGKLECDCGAPH